MDAQESYNAIANGRAILVMELELLRGGHGVRRPQICGVYLIRCLVNGKFYVGSSVHVLRRWRSHWQALRGNRHHCMRLQRCWNKYGADAFVLEVVERVGISDLLAAEDRQLSSVSSKLSCLNRGSVAVAPMSGLKHSAATRLKMSTMRKGRKFSPEWRANMSAAMKGIPKPRGWTHSAATRSKMSAALIGKPGGMLGKSHSQQTRQKMRTAHLRVDPVRRARGGSHGHARAVSIDGIGYPTVRAAAIGLGVEEATVVRRIRRGMGFYLDISGGCQIQPWGLEDKTGSKHKNARRVIVGGQEFPCCKDAADHFGIHPSSFAEWIQKGRARYADGLPPMKIGPRPRMAAATR